MSTGTCQNAAAAAELDEEPEPSSPAQPAADLTGLRQDFERFTFLQSVIQKGFMLESEARDMYIQLTDSETGTPLSSNSSPASTYTAPVPVADDGYEDFVADINELLTFLFLKMKRTIYHVCMKLTAQYLPHHYSTKCVCSAA